MTCRYSPIWTGSPNFVHQPYHRPYPSPTNPYIYIYMYTPQVHQSQELWYSSCQRPLGCGFTFRIPSFTLTLSGSFWVTLTNTPLKFNMEPEKGPWKRRSHLETIIFRFYVKLWGCIPCANLNFQVPQPYEKWRGSPSNRDLACDDHGIFHSPVFHWSITSWWLSHPVETY